MKTEPNKIVDSKTNNENKVSTPKTAKAAVQKVADPAKEKAELKDQVKKEKPVQDLEETLKLLEDLQKKMRHRDTLLNTTQKLNEFEINLAEDEDEMGGNQYNDCVLVIRDDHNRRFETKNPVVIEEVSSFIKNICAKKLTEIEATIVLP